MAEVQWNYRPCRARKVRVVVGDCDRFPLYWARVEGLVGQTVDAVEVSEADASGDQPFYLDDRDGSGWSKVTNGGGPDRPHRELQAAQVMPRD